ncbi:MAG: thioesterase [Coxiella sp. (in: Bacteria)]|nr:MAG: thioesterase [Coxiella sp. (in: g-proteobacteria)]
MALTTIANKVTASLIQLLQEKMHNDIPLTQHMGVVVTDYTPGHLTLAAPLDKNINHRHTAFGGSIASLATLVGWGLVYLELYQRQIDARVVIQHGSADYLRPIDDAFTATCCIDEEAHFDRFITTLIRRHIARIKLTSHVHCHDVVAATFKGSFVAKT